MTRPENPYLAVFQSHRYEEPHRNPLDTHDRIARRYAWAVPTPEAIGLLASYGPLVELGAGTGYWAWELRQGGVDIVAYDGEVPPTTWTEVLAGDVSSLGRHPDRTLLLCWPPADTLLAGHALLCYRGRRLFYVGEWGEDLPRGEEPCTGDPMFHRLLATQWQVHQRVAIPRWYLCADALYVFKRLVMKRSTLVEPPSRAWKWRWGERNCGE
jgi:hypothetical protein